MKELLKKAFEAGKDRQWSIEWNMSKSLDFEEWFKENEKLALTIPVVVGQSEQLVCKCGLPKDKKGGNFNCLRTDCNMTIAN